MSRTQTVYLVVRSDGDVRVAKRPRVAADEIAVAINLTFSDGWGQITHAIDVQMPDPPLASEVEVTDG